MMITINPDYITNLSKTKKIIWISSLISILVIGIAVGVAVPLSTKSHSAAKPIPASRIIPPPGFHYKNMYTLGDSLSDNGVFANLLYNINPFVADQLDRDKEAIEMEGFFDGHSFSNGPVTAEQLADLLHIKPFEAGYYYSTKFVKGWLWSDDEITKTGQNYALAGGRASKMYESDFLNNIFFTSFGNIPFPETWRTQITKSLADWFNQFTLDKQVSTLIHQHHGLDSDDITLLEIGGNDVFAAILEAGKEGKAEAVAMIKDAVKNEVAAANEILKNSRGSTLLIGNVPDVSLVPAEKDNKNVAKELSTEYNNELYSGLNEAGIFKPNESGNYVQFIDINKSFNKYYNEFKKNSNHNVTKAAYMEQGKIVIIEGWKPWVGMDATYNTGVSKKNVDNYFFFDQVHPTKWVTEKIAKDIYTIVKQHWEK